MNVLKIRMIVTQTLSAPIQSVVIPAIVRQDSTEMEKVVRVWPNINILLYS